MEFTIFFIPEVTAELKKYVEVRLHHDARNVPAEAIRRHAEYMNRTTKSSGIPVYIVVDPADPEAVIARFDGADLGGSRFRDFLARNVKKAD